MAGTQVTAAEILAGLQAKDSDKSLGNISAVVLLDQDPTLARLVSIWPNVGVPPLPLREVCPPGIPEAKRVRWLWALLDPDPIPAWLEQAGLPDAVHTRRACQVAIDNRMVHPDGTVSRWATQYIRNVVGGTLARRGVKLAKPADDGHAAGGGDGS